MTAVEPAEAGVQEMPLTLALAMVLHGIQQLEDEERRRVVDEAVARWNATKEATTLRHPAGTISLSVPKEKVRVVDGEAFLDWALAESEDPDLAVETVVRVRPAYEKAVLAGLVIADGRIVAKATGEVVDIPGVSIVPAADPHSISVTLSAETKAAAAVRARGWLDQVRQLAAGGKVQEGGDDS